MKVKETFRKVRYLISHPPKTLTKMKICHEISLSESVENLRIIIHCALIAFLKEITVKIVLIGAIIGAGNLL